MRGFDFYPFEQNNGDTKVIIIRRPVKLRKIKIYQFLIDIWKISTIALLIKLTMIFFLSNFPPHLVINLEISKLFTELLT